MTCPISLSGTIVLDTSANNQDIDLMNGVNGRGNLTFSSGAGAITLVGNVGSTTRIGNLMISSVGNLTTQAITASSITLTSSTGLVRMLGDLDTNTLTGISLTGAAFNLEGNITATSTGEFSITHSGILNFITNKTINSNGSFSQTGPGAVNLFGSIQTANTGITFASPITLIGASSMQTGAGAGNIQLTSAVNGTFNLNLSAGTGNIIFGAAIGGTTPLNNLTIQDAEDVTLTAMTTASLNQLAGTGTTTMNGDIITTGPAGITFVGNHFTRNASITTNNGGPLIITNSGILTFCSIECDIDRWALPSEWSGACSISRNRFNE